MVTLLSFLLVCYSCGPRTGIHHNDVIEESVTSFTDSSSNEINRKVTLDIAEKLFRQNCAVCHALTDQRLTGPGLEGLKNRLPDPKQEWFLGFMMNRDSLVKKKDPYLKQLLQANMNQSMHCQNYMMDKQKLQKIYVYLTSPWQRGCIAHD